MLLLNLKREIVVYFALMVLRSALQYKKGKVVVICDFAEILIRINPIRRNIFGDVFILI